MIEKLTVAVPQPFADAITDILKTRDWKLMQSLADGYFHSSEGQYTLQITAPKPHIVALFRLSQLVGCCGVCVSSGSVVCDEYRGKGLGTLLNKLRIHIATKDGYGTMLCTDVSHNTFSKKLLHKNGWHDVHTFCNPRSGNNVDISVIDLD